MLTSSRTQQKNIHDVKLYGETTKY